MYATRIVPAVAAALLFAALPHFATDASAKSSFMQACSDQWKAAKANNTVPSGMKWPEFVKTRCAQNSGDATGPATNADAGAAAVVTTKTKTAAKNGGNNFMKACGDSWKRMKAANTVPAGMTWKQFVKRNCSVDGAAADNSDSGPPLAPDKSFTMKPAADWSTIQVATVDKNGKPFTPGQIAAHQRIKECAAEWQANKEAGTLPVGEKWPQYWSACNSRLKAQRG